MSFDCKPKVTFMASLKINQALFVTKHTL